MKLKEKQLVTTSLYDIYPRLDVIVQKQVDSPLFCMLRSDASNIMIYNIGQISHRITEYINLR